MRYNNRLHGSRACGMGEGDAMEVGFVERMAAVKAHLKAVTLADVFDMRALGFALTLAWASIAFLSTTVHFSRLRQFLWVF